MADRIGISVFWPQDSHQKQLKKLKQLQQLLGLTKKHKNKVIKT